MLQIRKALELRILWLLKKALPSREEPGISLSIRHTFTSPHFTSPHLTSPHLTCVISLQRGSALNTRSNDFICTYIERVMSRKRKNRFVSPVRGETGVAGEGRVVGVPKFHSWGKYTMSLTNIDSD